MVNGEEKRAAKVSGPPAVDYLPNDPIFSHTLRAVDEPRAKPDFLFDQTPLQWSILQLNSPLMKI